jgi:sugar phosphate isomerase/epimerase
MQRRDFLACLLGGTAGAGSPAFAQSRHHAAHRAPATPSKLDRVAVSSWSFNNYFQSNRESSASVSTGRMALLDFPEMIADRYKVHNLEFVAPHFASVEPAYLQELKANLVRARSRLINIPVDIREIWRGGGLSDPDTAVRETVVAASQNWIDVAKQLGASSVRCDPGAFNPDDLTLTIESYRRLVAYGRTKDVIVLIENRGEMGSQHPEALVQLFLAVGGLFIGALPDFGNFPDNETRLRGLPMLFPYARTVCHAKGLNLDANGNETAFDFQKCIQTAKEAEFKGIYSIEYEGAGDPYAGVEAVITELIRYL